jgi:hypothetical protein
VPKLVRRLIAVLGSNRSEVAGLAARDWQTPYLLTPRTFCIAFAIKATDWHCFKSLLWQGVKMLNPKSYIDVMRPIMRRMGEKSVYYLE